MPYTPLFESSDMWTSLRTKNWCNFGKMLFLTATGTEPVVKM